MGKRIHLYTSRKDVAVWLMAVCLAVSAALRIGVYAPLAGVGVWAQIVLPCFATVLYVCITLLSGERMLYKTGAAVWLYGIACAWQLLAAPGASPMLTGMGCVCIVFFCIVYCGILGGRIRWPWLLLPLYLAVLGVAVYAHRSLCLHLTPTQALWRVLPDYLLVLGLLVMLFAVRVHTDGEYHPTWGDRPDGRRIRSIPAIDQISPYIMVNRTGANNLFCESAEITACERYIRKKRREGLTGFGMTHVILAAYARTIAKYPALNRFIAGQKLYSRGEDISVSMTVKKELTTSSPDTVIKVHLSPADTADEVYRKFSAEVEAAKSTPLDSNVDNTAGIMTLIPGLFLKFVVWLIKALDYLGLVPGFLLEISPFHGSVYFTSMGSLGIRPVYHHLYDFGTIPVFCAFGRKRRATEPVDGEMVERKYIDLKFNLDERICDGYYYAAVIKHFMRLLSHPEVLDMPPERVERDIP